MEVRSIETIVRALNGAKVKYLIVGGVAVVAHGYRKPSSPLDGRSESNAITAKTSGRN